MQNQFKEFVKNQSLFAPDERILLAVSGGLDSVVMMTLFKEAGFNFGVAHVNFQLRGEASEGDAQFVKQLAEEYQAPFFLKSVDAKVFSQTHQLSTQMAARELRYAWFEELLNTEGFSKLATAHHLNDSIETILLHLTKGTGLAGLVGIPLINAHIIRPLLFASRDEIENYAQKNQLTWREDASNQESTYQRNYLRHEVIPKLKKINPSLEHTFLDTIERIRYSNAILQEQFELLKAKAFHYFPTHTEISIEVLAQTAAPVLYLEYLLKEFGFNYAQTKQIWEAHQSESGKVFLSNEYLLNKDRNLFLITKKSSNQAMKYLIEAKQSVYEIAEFSIRVSIIERDKGFSIPQNKDILALDFEKLSFPLELSLWQQGDYFYPLGMTGKKKVSDFLIDLKVPLILKEKVWKLTTKQNIVGLIGYRPDNRYKITSTTKRILLVEKQ
jgi:tRNA(Ile)-lysidine synthase